MNNQRNSEEVKQKDLFGTKKIRKRHSRLQTILEKYDSETISGRIERLRWLEMVFPNYYGYLMSPEMHFIFTEAKMAFINGQYISTVLLATSFIEHWLGSHLKSKGFTNESEKGLSAIIDCMRVHSMLHVYLLDKVDEIRKIRNPFVHLKQYKHKYNLTERSISELKNPIDIMENDAKDALSIMYAIAIAKYY
jgi:hypothetical protein